MKKINYYFNNEIIFSAILFDSIPVIDLAPKGTITVVNGKEYIINGWIRRNAVHGLSLDNGYKSESDIRLVKFI